MNSLYRYTIAAILALSLSVFIGCSDDDDDDNPTGPSEQTTFEKLAELGDAYLGVATKNIDAATLWTEMNDADDTQPYIISIRSLKDDTVRGRIPGAVHWDVADLLNNYDQLPSGKKIVVYCYTGQTASYTASYLNMMGFDAYNLKWGFCSWTSDTSQTGASGGWYTMEPGMQTLEQTANAFGQEYDYPEITCTATTDQGMIAERCASIIGSWKFKNASDVYANINDGDSSNDWYLLCYWGESPYNAGHIPGSIRFNPTSLSLDENLKYVPTDRPVIVYCYTGQTSAQVCTYLNMLGYDAYSMRYGMNAVTNDANILGGTLWTDLTPSYPVTTGGF